MNQSRISVSKKNIKNVNKVMNVQFFDEFSLVLTGDNFMSEIYRIFCRNKNSIDNGSLILKIAPRHLARREKFQLHSLFRREIIVYDQVTTSFTFSSTCLKYFD